MRKALRRGTLLAAIVAVGTAASTAGAAVPGPQGTIQKIERVSGALPGDVMALPCLAQPQEVADGDRVVAELASALRRQFCVDPAAGASTPAAGLRVTDTGVVLVATPEAERGLQRMMERAAMAGATQAQVDQALGQTFDLGGSHGSEQPEIVARSFWGKVWGAVKAVGKWVIDHVTVTSHSIGYKGKF